MAGKINAKLSNSALTTLVSPCRHCHFTKDSVIMEDLASEIENLSCELYLSLGLKDIGRKILGTPQVLTHLSSVLERSVQRNEQTEHVGDNLTIFHGVRAPKLTIQQYMNRIFKYFSCSPSCFVIAQIYLDRFLKITGGHLNSFNVHRLLVTSIMVAAKFNDDAFFNNAYYAKVGGVSTRELNRLEVKLLFSIDFRLFVSVDTFLMYCEQLEKEAGLEIERPIQVCRVKQGWSGKEEPICGSVDRS